MFKARAPKAGQQSRRQQPTEDNHHHDAESVVNNINNETNKQIDRQDDEPEVKIQIKRPRVIGSSNVLSTSTFTTKKWKSNASTVSSSNIGDENENKDEEEGGDDGINNGNHNKDIIVSHTSVGSEASINIVSRVPSRVQPKKSTFMKQSAYASMSGSYSTEQLSALKATQQFKTVTNIDQNSESFNTEDEIALELSGEEAEDFEAKLSSYQQNIQSTDINFSTQDNILEANTSADILDGSKSDSFLDEETDFKQKLKNKIAAITRQAAVNKQQQVILSEEDSFSRPKTKSSLPSYIPLQSTNNSVKLSAGAMAKEYEWEEAMMRRGMRISTTTSLQDIENTALHKLNEINNSTSTSTTTSISENKPSTSNSITFDDIQLSLIETMDTLKESIYQNERGYETMRVDVDSCSKEEIKLRSQLEEKIILVNDTQEFRLFCSELIGMLRAKINMIQDLKQAILQENNHFRDNVLLSRVIQQEDDVYRIKQVNQLIQIGTIYQPKAILLEKDGSTNLMINNQSMSLEEREAQVAKYYQQQYTEKSSTQLAIVDCSIYQYESDLARKLKKQEDFQEAFRLIFDDIRPEIKSIPVIIEHMLEFKRKHPEQFQSTYITHSLLGLLEPLIQADLLLLNILHQPIDITARDWFSPLLAFDSYSQSTDVVTSTTSNSEKTIELEQILLLPQVISRVVFPWLLDYCLTTLDPLSTIHNNNLINLLSQLVKDNLVHIFDPIPTITLIFESYTSAFKTILIPQVKIFPGSLGVTFLTKQVQKATLLIQHLSAFLPFLPQNDIIDAVWGRFQTLLVDSCCRLVNVSDGYHIVIQLCTVILSVFPVQANAAIMLGKAGKASIKLREGMIAIESIVELQLKDGNSDTSADVHVIQATQRNKLKELIREVASM